MSWWTGGVPHYSFHTSCEVQAPVADVAAVLVDISRYPLWWPQMRAVARIDDDTARVLVRSTLPVTLDLVVRAMSTQAPVLEVALDGTVRGWARWTLTATPHGTRCDYRQEVSLTGGMGTLSALARPLLRWNHQRAMAGCERGLRDRLECERAA